MKLFVNQKPHDLTLLSTYDRMALFKQWYDTKCTIECGCITNREKHPGLHVKSRSVKGKVNQYIYFLANNPGHNIPHDTTCPLNLTYRDFLSKKGIKVDEEGVMACTLAFKKKKKKPGLDSLITTDERRKTHSSSPTRSSSTLKTLFLAILQKEEAHIDSFRPREKRNISGRLYTAARKVKVGKSTLYTKEEKRVYFACSFKGKPQLISNRTEYPTSPYLIVGWGTRDAEVKPNPFNTNKVDIPLYSVDDTNTLITHLTIFKSTYQKAVERIEKEKRYNAVNTGYWVLWRTIKDRSPQPCYFEEKELLFIPADPFSRIPVESSYEEEMLSHLIQENRQFKKPLIADEFCENIKEIRPDFILLDTTPHTMIEVAGLKKAEYLNHLEKKEKQYIESGYQYVEWKPYNIPIEEVTLPEG